MDPLPIALIGWLFAGLSTLSLVLGALTIIAMHRSGDTARDMLARTVVNDVLLFAIWVLGLAGSIGVLRLESWGRDLLEFFCWVLIPLVVFSGIQRLSGARKVVEAEGGEMRWVPAIAGVLVVALPIVTLAGASIYTLRSTEVQQAFSR